jgi:hypothetical protein
MRLIGQWHLVMQATSAPEAGRTVEGALVLAPYEGRYRHETPVFLRLPDTTVGTQTLARHDFDSVVAWTPRGSRTIYGHTEINLGDVGAPTPGDITSPLPGKPGVILSGTELHFGRPPLGFYQEDGFSTVLTIDSIGPRIFTGRWDTSLGFLTRVAPDSIATLPNPAGTFCAERVVQ